MRRLTACAAFGIAVSLLGCNDSVTAPDGRDPMRDFHWEGSLDPSQQVEILGINGGIRAQRASGSMVVIDATVHGADALGAPVRVEAVRHAGGVTVCARYPDRNGRLTPCPWNSTSQSIQTQDVRVEFEVHMPGDIALVSSTVNGNVTADIRGDVLASTTNGTIDVETEGIARASTVNGSITASMGATDWHRALQFTSVNGSIQVAISPNVDALIDGVTANGRIVTDFPLAITSQGNARHIRGSLNAGTWSLVLSTVNGDLTLRERH